MTSRELFRHVYWLYTACFSYFLETVNDTESYKCKYEFAKLAEHLHQPRKVPTRQQLAEVIKRKTNVLFSPETLCFKREQTSEIDHPSCLNVTN